MRKEREFVNRFDSCRIGRQFVHISVVANYCAGRFRALLEFGSQAGTGFVCVRTAVPFDLERATTLHCRPRAVCNYGDPARAVSIWFDGFDLEYVFNPENCFCCGCIETFHLATKSWAAGHDRVQHVGNLCVEAEFRSAIGLRGDFNSRNGAANDREIFRIFEPDVVLRWHGQLCRGRGDFPVSEAPLGVVINHSSIFC